MIAVIFRIGFENTSFVVDEEVGMQEVCVRVFEPGVMTEIPPDTSIFATVRTVPGTAGMLWLVGYCTYHHN